ncbi:MAG TPA: UDP-glucose 4-epimerase GalE [Acidimicrobiales bacterium]|nr:UDP-glucose 4-epimerase GalE [Acidimicrobiales bacterium]
MGRILVTGGAGYIGSHTLRHLLAAGHEAVVLDDFSAGHRAALPEGVPVVESSIADSAIVAKVLADYRPAAVVHFAGSIEAGESMTDPRRFYANNFTAGLALLDAVVDAAGDGGPVPVVFSSTAAVYGDPVEVPIAETAATEPTNVYGETKLAFERALAAYDRAYGLRYIALRYFNACGAAADASIGPDHRMKTHLMTIAMLAALGQRDAVLVMGTDYPTPDGTGIRDYIHVDDLAAAHVLAIDALASGAQSTAYNVGVGRGFSVQEVLDAVDRVVGRAVPRRVAPRRAGDPAHLVADSTRIQAELGWRPQYTDLDAIVATAWRWHSSHPHGYGD